MAGFDNLSNNKYADDVTDEAEYDIPPNGQVVFFNDDYTTADFVVEVLVSVFHKSVQEANAIMQSVHKLGSGVVGVYAFDIAISRANVTTRRARSRGFPLRVDVQEIY